MYKIMIRINRESVQVSAYRAFLTLVLALLLGACGRAPETTPTVAEPAGVAISADMPQAPAAHESAEAGPETKPAATAEPTAAPPEATVAAGETPTQPALAPETTATDTEPEPPPAVVEWASRAPLPEANSEIAVAELAGLIYVIGGYPSSRVTVSSVQQYDPAGDRWTLVSPLPGPVNHAMPTARNHLAAVAIDGLVYVVGGRFGAGFNSEMTDVLEIFDPGTNIWTAGASMPTVRGGLNAVAANGCLHVFGGEGSNGVFAEHELYDPAAGSWRSLDPMPTPVHGVTGAAFLDGLIYLPGGGTAVGGSSGSTLHQVVTAPMSC
jgi:N-acetylneuraminic acid mutarotase